MHRRQTDAKQTIVVETPVRETEIAAVRIGRHKLG
jgi:hypothetical protein